MFILNEKPAGFILAIHNQKDSILKIGREFYSCNNSIYEALDRFEKWGLIEVTKGRRDLKVKFTKKGNQAIQAISELALY